jgi:hypothetical protein
MTESRTRFLVYANTIHIIVLFVVINVALAVLFLVKDRLSASDAADKTTTISASDAADKTTTTRWFDYSVYEAIADQVYVGTVLDDFTRLGELGFVYQPWVQFSEPPYDGKLLHVDTDAHGLPRRRTVNPSGERSEKTALLRILVLGGSTTFGYNVSDEHTWPSHLSAVLNERAIQLGLALRIEVTNYGRGYYYSTQEVFLLAQLLKGGQRPNLVVFLDGLNDNWTCGDVPTFTHKLADTTRNLQFERALSPVDRFDWLPIVRLAKAVSRRMASPSSSPPPDQTADRCRAITGQGIASVADRYRQNVEIARAISKLYGISTLFFLQPDPTVHYSPALYPNLPGLDEFKKIAKLATPEFYRMVRDVEGVIDLTNLFELWGPTRKAMIDAVHYSPQFNLFLAQHIGDHIDLVSLANSGAINAGIGGEVGSSR